MPGVRTFGGGSAGANQLKQAGKFNPEEAQTILEWIQEVTGESINTDGDRRNFVAVLGDGLLLCKLANTIIPGSIGKTQKPNSAFAKMENINLFTDFAQHKLGIEPLTLFQTVDLAEQRDLFSVCICLRAVATKAIPWNMHGLIIEGVVYFIQEHFGAETLHDVFSMAEISNPIFSTHERYSEAMLPNIYDALAEITQEPLQELIALSGRYFVHFLARYDYDALLRVLGRTFTDLLRGLDNLHEFFRNSYPELRPPSFYVERESRHGAVLHYRSRRRGFISYVLGQLTELASLFYNIELTIQVMKREEKCNVVYSVMKLTYPNEDFLAERKRIHDFREQSLDLEIDTQSFIGMFPFFVAFNRDLKILAIGRGLRHAFPDRNYFLNKSLDEEFTLVRPFVKFTWTNIKAHRAVVFKLQSGRLLQRSTQQRKRNSILVQVFDENQPNAQHRFEVAGERVPSPTNHSTEEGIPLVLKGQMVYLHHKEVMMFLASVQVNDLGDLYQTGFCVNDYSISDCNRDMMMATVQKSDDLKMLLQSVSDACNRDMMMATVQKSDDLKMLLQSVSDACNRDMMMATVQKSDDLKMLLQSVSDACNRDMMMATVQKSDDLKMLLQSVSDACNRDMMMATVQKSDDLKMLLQSVSDACNRDMMMATVQKSDDLKMLLQSVSDACNRDMMMATVQKSDDLKMLLQSVSDACNRDMMMATVQKSDDLKMLLQSVSDACNRDMMMATVQKSDDLKMLLQSVSDACNRDMMMATVQKSDDLKMLLQSVSDACNRDMMMATVQKSDDLKMLLQSVSDACNRDMMMATVQKSDDLKMLLQSVSDACNRDMMMATVQKSDDLKMLLQSVSDACNRDMMMATVQKSDDLKMLLQSEKGKSRAINRNMGLIKEATQSTIKQLRVLMPKSIAVAVGKHNALEQIRVTRSFPMLSMAAITVSDFNSTVQSLTAQQIVLLLNKLALKIENLCEKHGVYVVEAIGEYYILGCGVRKASPNHFEYLADCVLEIVEQMQQSTDQLDNGRVLKIVVGIHSGPAVGGVVGGPSPRYRIYGEAQAVATKMMYAAKEDFCIMSNQLTVDLLENQDLFIFEEAGQTKLRGKGRVTLCRLLGKRGARRAEINPLHTEADILAERTVEVEQTHSQYEVVESDADSRISSSASVRVDVSEQNVRSGADSRLSEASSMVSSNPDRHDEHLHALMAPEDALSHEKSKALADAINKAMENLARLKVKDHVVAIKSAHRHPARKVSASHVVDFEEFE